MLEQLRPQDATIGVITALSKENTAVLRAFGCNSRETFVPGNGAGRRYHVVAIPAFSGGAHIVAIALLLDMGNDAAAIRATLMLEHCPSIRHIIMTGIAGAIPNPTRAEDHVRLGDIVVSSHSGVVQYDYKKESIEKKLAKGPILRAIDRVLRRIKMNLGSAQRPSDFYDAIEDRYTTTSEARHRPRPPSAQLIEAVNSLESRSLDGQYPWESSIASITGALDETWQRPRQERDRLQDWNDGWPPTKHPADPKRRVGIPRVFLGTIASGNILLKNPLLRDALRDKFKARAVEMEGSGIADAAWTHEVGYLVVRGTCDYCNRDKGDDWQNYAAVIAACYTRSIIEMMDASNAPIARGLGRSPSDHLERISGTQGHGGREDKEAQPTSGEMDVTPDVLRSVWNGSNTVAFIDKAGRSGLTPIRAAAKEVGTISTSDYASTAKMLANSVSVELGTEGGSVQRAVSGEREIDSEIGSRLADMQNRIIKLVATLDHRQAQMVVDGEIIPLLHKVGRQLPGSKLAEVYVMIAEVKARHSAMAESPDEKMQLLTEAELYSAKAKNELGKR